MQNNKIIRFFHSRLFCCLLFLGLSLIASVKIMRRSHVQQQMITMWMPLPDSMTEEDARITFEKLTNGFEELYPGYGIDLSIYAVDAYQKTLETPNSEFPVVWIDSPECPIQKMDLSELLHRLEQEHYVTDFSEFQNCVPLSWNIPVVYSCDLQNRGKVIERASIPADAENADLNVFLEDPHDSIVSDSSRLAVIENNSLTSGAVCMIPITENNLFEVQYQDYCCINADSDSDSQKIAVLWIGYLLSEQAQKILYTEHYGNFPLHKSALSQTFSQHQALSIIADLAAAREDFL